MEKIDTSKQNNNNNQSNDESNENKLGLLEIEEMLKNNIKPPGIMEYDDMPPETPLEPSQSTKSKAKKVKIKQFLFKIFNNFSLFLFEFIHKALGSR